nr:class I SAM-dependent methyltransferase [Streptomyces scabichelini]
MEIGCGGGVAVATICSLLSTGSITAIDRSATMTARARRRNADHVHAGRVTIVTAAFSVGELADSGIGGRRFDKIFAINVNLFWTGPARDELALAKNLLAPGGTLHVFYEPPGRRTDEIVAKVTGALDAGGFAPAVTLSASVLGIVARPRPAG